jgi:hypothetical protein
MRILFSIVLGLLLVLSFRSMQKITQNVQIYERSYERPVDASLNVQIGANRQEALPAGAPERHVIGLLAGFSLLLFVMMNSKRPVLA